KLSRRRNIDSYEYRYWSEAGSNVDIYVLDSGVNIHHPEFGGRAFNFKGLDFSPYIRPDMDPDGTERTMMDTTPATHGTCIASLAAGNTFGTAKRANIINVKVGTKIGGNTIEIARAIFDVTKIHNQRKLLNRLSPFAGSVISLSMSGGFDRAVEIAIKRAVYAGIPVVVPAGDTNSDASTAFPCNMTEVICVAAVDERYRKTNTSNYGPDVTLAAPGQDTWCATFQGNSFNSYRFGSIFIPSGTSLAVPYVSGTLSLFIS
ncbi:subtilisin-like protein, partial [Viridothelium virens]